MVIENFEPMSHISVFTTLEIMVCVAMFFAIMMSVFNCAWCFGSKSDDDEEMIKPVKKKTSMKDRWEKYVRKRVSKHKRSPPAIGRSSIKFSRPSEKRTVKTHVQPVPKPYNGSEFPVEAAKEVSGTQQEHSEHNHTSHEATECRIWREMLNISNLLLPNPMESEMAESDIPVDPREGVDCHLGKIQLSISYDFLTSDLRINVLQAKDLPPKDVSGTSDPYVKVILLPDKKNKFFTRVKSRNLNPVWNECFLFEKWPYNKLQDKILYLKVLDYDRFSRDDPIGETFIPLYEMDFSHMTTIWRYLQPCKDTRGKLGEILLSLCYQPSVGQLNVIVMKAKDLQAKDITGSSDPYVKLWLKYGKIRVYKKKTSVKMRTLQPIYNESFMFDIPWTKIRDAEIEISVMDFDQIGRNEMIGRIVLGNRSGPLESKHWNDMIMRPRRQVAQWHLLKD